MWRPLLVHVVAAAGYRTFTVAGVEHEGIPAVRSRAQAELAAYAPDRPLASYLTLSVAYGVLTSAGVLSALRRKRRAHASATDLLLLATGTFKLSRLIGKDRVTAFLRAPFARFVEEGDGAEVNEEPRGEGLQRAIGELLTCPFCLNQWTGAALAVSWLHAPRATRAAAGVLTGIALADVLHVGWTRLESLE